jgi:hypothetical protein
MRWARDVEVMGTMRNTYKILVGNSEGKRPLRRPRSGGRIILKWILEKYGWMVWTGFIWLRIRTGGGLL